MKDLESSYILDLGPKDRQPYAGLRLGGQVAFKERKHARLHLKTPCANCNRRVLQVRIENDQRGFQFELSDAR